MALPSMVADNLAVLSSRSQEQFWEEFRRNRKSHLLIFVSWLFFGCHYIYCGGKWGLQLLFWFTLGGLGIWYLIDLIRIWRMVSNHNKNVAIETLKNVQALKVNHNEGE